MTSAKCTASKNAASKNERKYDFDYMFEDGTGSHYESLSVEQPFRPRTRVRSYTKLKVVSLPTISEDFEQHFKWNQKYTMAGPFS